MDNELHIINIRATKGFVERLKEHLDRHNESNRFGLKLTRSQIMRKLTEEWMNNNDKGANA